MRKTFTLALLAVGLMASAQELRFEGTQGIFNKSMPVSEMKSLSHTLDADGNPIIVMESLCGAKYTSPAKGVTITTSTRSEPSNCPAIGGKWQHVEYIKPYTNIDDLEYGDLIGYAAKKDYSFDEYIDATYWLAAYMGVDMGGMVKPYLLANLAILATTNGCLMENIRFQTYDVMYVGVDNKGNKIPVSGRFLYPYNKNNNHLHLSDIYLDNHGTVFRKMREPSNDFSFFSPAPVCTKGYLIVQPDLIGFGATESYSQQYIDKNINGAESAYAVIAAQQFIKWMKDNNVEHGFCMEANPSVIVSGLSQGATTALGATWFIENELDKNKFKINLKETRICSGAYNMELCMNWFAETDNLTYPIKVPAMFIGVATSHNDMLKSSTGEQYYIHDYFSPIASQYQHSDKNDFGETENFGNIWQIIDCLNMVQTVPQTCLYYAFAGGPNPQVGPSMHKMLASDLFTGDEWNAPLNWECDKLKALKKYLDMNNLADPNVWKPKNPIKMMVTTKDDIIPQETSLEFYNNMRPYNKNICLTVLEEVPQAFDAASGYGPHMMACFVWAIAEMTGLPVTIINEIMMKQLAGDDK